MNMPMLTPYLCFDGTCQEAMTFYQQCLGGELMVQHFAGTPAAEHVAPEAQNGVLHSVLSTDRFTLMASDAGMQKITKGNMVSLSLDCKSEEEITRYFTVLSEGGTVTMPLADTFWGALFGMFTDRFGIDWMVNYDKPAQS
ncbi:VOC family protein [Hymenobacter sediminis]|uniref:VOC family protein n=1 Tax=Hymenobacter sediminis TaxID=2218621 RepID=UPI00192E582F|nr:VOC family protein [Hymenobacter sediminis]